MSDLDNKDVIKRMKAAQAGKPIRKGNAEPLPASAFTWRFGMTLDEKVKYWAGREVLPGGLASDIRNDCVSLANEVVRLRNLIDHHNDQCQSMCPQLAANHCEAYTARGERCPECPKEWLI